MGAVQVSIKYEGCKVKQHLKRS